MDLGFAAVQEADGDWGDDDAPETQEVAAVQRAEPEPVASTPAPAPQVALEDAPRGSLPPSNRIESGGASIGSEARILPAPSGEPALPNGHGAPPSKIHSNQRTRYFVIKSNNHKNLVLSVENNVWATQRHNEEKLNEAFSAAPHVILIFSVNLSGCFQGYAKMVGPVGKSRKVGVFQGFGRAFDVRWLRLDDLDFSQVANIMNPWNENKSVKASRDGQELPNEVGRRVCEMVDHRVYRADPANYITDEKEVETGGFGPPLLSHRPPEDMASSMPPLAPDPLLAHPLTQPPLGMYGAPGALPPHAGGQPALPPGHDAYPPGPGAPHAWNPWAYPGAPWPPYHPWGSSSGSSYSSSSYSSYSYSDSEEDEAEASAAAKAPMPLQPQLQPQAQPGLQPQLQQPQPQPQFQPQLQPQAPPASIPAGAPAVSAASSTLLAREEARAKEAKLAKEAKQVRETKPSKEAKEAKQPKEQKAPKASKIEKAPKVSKEKEKKSDRKGKRRAEKEESKKEATSGHREKRQKLALKEATGDGDSHSRRSSREEAGGKRSERHQKVVLKEAKDCGGREDRPRESEHTSRDRRRRERRSDRDGGQSHARKSAREPQQDAGQNTAAHGAAGQPSYQGARYLPPRGPSPPQHHVAGPGAPPHLGGPPRGHLPPHWASPTGYGHPPHHAHSGLPPPRALSPAMAGAPDWRSHASPRGAPPLEWRGACPLRS